MNKYGQEYNAGRIDYRINTKDREKLQEIFCGTSEFFINNLSFKRFRGLYGSAVQSDRHINGNSSNEWRRRLKLQDGTFAEALCNPEDVVQSAECRHDARSEICFSHPF